MTLIALLCAIALQYYCPAWRLSLKAWLRYHDWLIGAARSFVDQSKLIRAVVLIVPLWFVVVIVLSIVQAILGPMSGFLITALIAWCVIDVRVLFSKDSTSSIEQFLSDSVYAVFTPVFWLAILGWPALLLYLIIWRCHQQEDAMPEVGADEDEMTHRLRHQPAGLFLALLEWIPARLMMLSAVVVGYLSAVRRLCSEVFKGLSLGVVPLQQCFYPENQLSDKATLEHRQVLVYVLAVWLAVMVVFFLGAILG